MDKALTLAWLHEICADAITEARRGNDLPANRLGGHKVLAHYLNNVYALGSIKPDDWAHWYPEYMQEADNLRIASETQEEQAQHGDRITALEAKFDELMAALKPLIEAKQEPAPEQPKRKARKAQVEEAVEPEAEPAEEAPAEEPEAEEVPNPAVYDGDDKQEDAKEA